MKTERNLYRICVLSLLGSLCGIILLRGIDICWSVYGHPIGRLVLLSVFVVLVTLSLIIGKKEGMVYLYLFSFPAMKIGFVLIILTCLLAITYHKEIFDFCRAKRYCYGFSLGVILFCFVLTTVISRYPYAAISKALFYFCLGIGYLALTAYMTSEREIRRVLCLLLVVLSFCVAISFLQSLLGVAYLRFSFWELNPNVGIYESLKRIPSVFWEAQMAGQYFAVSVILCFAASRSYLRDSRRLNLLTLSGIIALLLTGSRIAIIALVVATLFLVLSTLSFKKAVTMVVITTLFLFFGNQVYKSILSAHIGQRISPHEIEDTYDLRYTLWKESLPIAVSNPWGVGLGGENLYEAGRTHGVSFVSQFAEAKDSIKYTHFENSYLQLLYSLGFLGLFGFVMLLVKYFLTGFRIFRKISYLEEDRMMALYLAGAMVGWSICIVTSPLIDEPQSMFVFIVLLALMNSLKIISTNNETKKVNTSFA